MFLTKKHTATKKRSRKYRFSIFMRACYVLNDFLIAGCNQTITNVVRWIPYPFLIHFVT